MYLSIVAATKAAFWQEIVCVVYVAAVGMSFAMIETKGLNNEFDKCEFY